MQQNIPDCFIYCAQAQFLYKGSSSFVAERDKTFNIVPTHLGICLEGSILMILNIYTRTAIQIIKQPT